MGARSLMKDIPVILVSLANYFTHFPKKSKLAARRPPLMYVLAVCLCLLVLTPCQAQITNVTDETAAPTPGSGHNYFKMLNETVNPANGSVSLNISVPIPKGRGLTLPFSFDYSSDAVQVMQASNGAATWASDSGPVAGGGWSYSVPQLGYSLVQQPQSYKGKLEYCTWHSNFVYSDPSGGGHPLDIATREGNSQYPSLCPAQNITPGGDAFVQAAFPNCTSEPCHQVAVADVDGTTAFFGDGASGGQDLASSVVDRNGNAVTINWDPVSQNGSFSYTDTAGRTALSSSGFGTASGQSYTVSVSGLSQPYTVYWGAATANYNVGFTNVGLSGADGCNGVGGVNQTIPVISEIKLPNGQAYYFYYDGTYGLLDEIKYPTGGWIKYSWAVDPNSELAEVPTAAGGSGCAYEHGWPRLTQRQVSFDGSTVALVQNFSYSTTWQSTPQNGWSSKQTTVSTTDEVTGVGKETVYTYTGDQLGNNQPVGTVSPSFGAEMPVEQQVVYDNGSNQTMRIENKSWIGDTEMTCDSTTQDGETSRTDYSYGAGVQVTDKKEWDWGSAPACGSSSSGTPLRETATVYDTSLTNSFGFKIEDRPSQITIYGSGAQAAETTYGYDSHGNALNKTRVCLNGCPGAPGNAATNYLYGNSDGQVTSATDPRGNTTHYTYMCSGTYLSQIQLPSGLTENFNYDCASGELIGSEDENGNWTYYQYADSLNRLTEIDYPDGGKTTYSYNDGTRTVTVDKLLSSGVSANASTTTMDGMGRAVKTVGENGAETDMTYDGESALHVRTNPGDSSHYITYNHDALGRLTTTVYQDGGTASVTYTGNCATTTDPAQKTNTSCSDALGRMTSDSDGLGNTTTYGYDALDNLSSASQGGQSRSFLYNSLSEVYQATNPESGTTSYTYDGNGTSPPGRMHAI